MGAPVKRLCTICARGGSKGVPNKNLRLLQGRPLIAHSISQALESRLFDLVAVSSDSNAILGAAETAGAHLLIKRPDELASDTSGKIPAILHAVEAAEKFADTQYPVLVDLDATSPLRDVSDIIGAVKMLEKSTSSNVITASPARRSPYFNLVEQDDRGFVHLSKSTRDIVKRRQDAPACFDMNASIYVWRRESFLASPSVFYEDTRLFVMPEERSHDIDSELDFKLVSFLMNLRQKEA